MKRLLAALAISALTLTASLGSTTNTPPVRPAKEYVASSQRKPFHRPDCQAAKRISPENKQIFKTRDEAIAAGHVPCKICKP
jgi:hypothetical protein